MRLSTLRYLVRYQPECRWLRSRALQAEHLDGVPAHDLVDVGIAQVAHHLPRHRAGLRPGRVGVRIVGLECDAIRSDGAERVQPVLVAEKAAVDLASEVGRRWFEHNLSHATPRPVLPPDIISPFEDI